MVRRSRSGFLVALRALPGVLAVGCGGPAFEQGAPTDAGVDHTAPPIDATLDDASEAATGEVDDGADPTWAQWPMPNSISDVEAGAPNLESYTDNRDGTVTDNVTGLMWQQTPEDDAGGTFPIYTWLAPDGGGGSGGEYCAGLQLAGHRDWRLPALIELVSIVNYDVAFTGDVPSIDPAYFPDTPASSFWSATPTAGQPGYAWGVSFDYGYSGRGDVTAPAWVRCVR
jgi:hypothetical protein